MENNQENSYIDIGAIFRTIWQRRKVFYIVLPVTFVLACAFILCVPRYYRVEVKLAPEVQSSTPSTSLMALASTFGFDVGSMMSRDAIYPVLYPDIVSSANFLVKLFDMPVTTIDEEYSATYYQYIVEKKRYPFWKRWKGKLKKLLSSDDVVSNNKQRNRSSSDGSDIDVFWLSENQKGVVAVMKENIQCDVDKKTDVVTITVSDQDPLICALLADSVCAALQSFITEYRTSKARVDMLYYKNVMDSAYKEYLHESERYTRYIDGHKDLSLEKYRVEAQNLESEMQIKFSAYTSFQKQYMATQARIQENTPMFTVMQSAIVPLRPAGPKRMIFVLAMLIFATLVTVTVVCWKQIRVFWMG